MNLFDAEIMAFLNQFSQFSLIFDSLIVFISKNHLIKGGVLLTVFCWGWFRVTSTHHLVKIHLISALIGCFVSMALARTLAVILPFRLRPIHEENLDFRLPHGMELSILDGWSSLPSDHAVLFFALATGIFYIGKWIGLFAMLYTFIMIGLPRIYLGLHYPTDIIVGAIVGISVVLLCQASYLRKKISEPVVSFSLNKPELFYPLFFIVLYQIADMFNSARELIGFASSMLKSLMT